MKLLLTTIAAVVLATTTFAGPIHDAAKKGNLRAVMQHLAAGTDVNAKDNLGSTPLHSAAMGGHKKIVEVLISNGADVNSTNEDGRTPLDFAGGETAELLRKHGGKAKAPNMSINKAAGQGDGINTNIEAIKQHLAAGVDVNERDPLDGDKIPLMHAVYWGHKEIVELLVAKGADINMIDSLKGYTSLHWGIVGWGWQKEEGRQKEIVELLIANGADLNAKAKRGETPLDLAATFRHRRTETPELLRKHGAKTGKELAMMPRLEYGEDQWPFGFSFTAKRRMTYVVEVTQDFKQWGELETIKGTGKWVKFIDPRQPLVQFKRNFYRVKVVD